MTTAVRLCVEQSMPRYNGMYKHHTEAQNHGSTEIISSAIQSCIVGVT